MKVSFLHLLCLNAALASASVVKGAAEGFAAGVTGGGDTTPSYPKTNEELVSLLESDEPQVVVLTKTFDFIGTEGTTTEAGCAPWGTGKACQLAINSNGWCGKNPAVTVTYDKAAKNGIHIKSNKTLVGEGDKGVLSGKGLYFEGGVSNIIVQNIKITDLNPGFVWGGDAFTFFGADLIWIDHCETSLIGRQHYVTGFHPNTRMTWSNNFLNGKTTHSAGCDDHHYWTLELVGKGDEITFQNNYVYHTTGRGPALSGTTLFHAVNSVWSSIPGHAIEGNEKGRGIFEGCFFEDVVEVAPAKPENQLFSASEANAASCKSALGRACQPNGYSKSGAFSSSETGFFSDFSGLTIAAAGSATDARGYVPKNCGIGRI
ncbi:polysaccharide lyase family 1 protein [Aspergillus vadensis CBS 113365]|uniref:pectin lyase n=1 Tax=Aspergillus vadensis (strain CBS 113365 / IMI 142717 / IBT 24658) TaxID=1448311 RepID=A0A319B4D0_ASPVC|nr:pectin lyase C [Aspergillus vadensis CBS 113365]PYH67636.1 pectin lyase C [Aspergillus vadensis CBS 113365]